MRVWTAGICLAVALVASAPVIAGQTPPRPPAAGSPARLALVVGNDAYPRPLKNPVNDARAVGEALRELGFTVTVVENTKLIDLDRAVRTFASSITPGGVALFYYAGHGFQIAGRNYLVPVDFQAADEVDAKYRALAADFVREKLEVAGARLTVLVLDACRDNPFRASRDGSGGLAGMEGGAGTLIAMAAAPGRTAGDGSGRHSLFTGFLLDALRVPGLGLEAIFDRVRQQVYEASNRQQLPYTASGVIGEFVLRPATAAASSPARRRDQLTGASLDALRGECDRREAAACDELGRRYLGGQGVAASDGLARDAFDRACTFGDAMGCSRLGYLVEAGRSVAADAARAAGFYARGCEGGASFGCLRLGLMYANGRGVARDDARAVALYDRACTGGEAAACSNLGLMYQNGRGTTQDMARAVAYYTSACDGWDGIGCAHLGVMYDLGLGTAADEALAVRVYRRACDLGGGSGGCVMLALKYANGRGGMAKDLARAAQLYQQGCEDGEVSACALLGEAHEKGAGVPVDKAKALQWFSRACQSGDEKGCEGVTRLRGV